MGQDSWPQIVTPCRQAPIEHPKNADYNDSLPSPWMDQSKYDSLKEHAEPEASGECAELALKVAAKDQFLGEPGAERDRDPDSDLENSAHWKGLVVRTGGRSEKSTQDSPDCNCSRFPCNPERRSNREILQYVAYARPSSSGELQQAATSVLHTAQTYQRMPQSKISDSMSPGITLL